MRGEPRERFPSRLTVWEEIDCYPKKICFDGFVFDLFSDVS